MTCAAVVSLLAWDLRRAQLSVAKSDGLCHPNWDTRVRELTDDRGVDCVVEIGGPGTIAMSLKAFGSAQAHDAR